MFWCLHGDSCLNRGFSWISQISRIEGFVQSMVFGLAGARSVRDVTCLNRGFSRITQITRISRLRNSITFIV